MHIGDNKAHNINQKQQYFLVRKQHYSKCFYFTTHMTYHTMGYGIC